MSLASQLARLLSDRELCARCLSFSANLDEEATQAVLSALGASVLIIEATAVCRWCRTLRQTFMMPTRYE